jgi:hypothetical protein
MDECNAWILGAFFLGEVIGALFMLYFMLRYLKKKFAGKL